MAWYRAHNASIVAGYIEHHALCAAELSVERFFMNVALGRVLYAHALVASPKLALGRARAVSRVLGDPRWRGADVFLSLHNILPDRYPLVGFTLSEILVLTSTLSVPAGSVLERLAHVLDLRRRLRLRVVLQYLDVLAQVSE